MLLTDNSLRKMEDDSENHVSVSEESDAEEMDALPLTTPTTCNWPGCGRAFPKPSRLQEHMYSHTGEVRVHVVLLTISARLFARLKNAQNRLFGRLTCMHMKSLILESRTFCSCIMMLC